MAFDDLPLSRPPAPEPPARRPSQSSTSRWVIVCGNLVAGVALTLWWMSRAQPPSVIPSPTSPTNPTTESRRPKPEPLHLPSLLDSDAMLREAAGTLSRNPLLARLVATRGLVRNATLAIVQIGDGKTPAVPLAVLRPPVRLQIPRQQSGRVEAASFARWEAATRPFFNAPSDSRVYVNVKEPLRAIAIRLSEGRLRRRTVKGDPRDRRYSSISSRLIRQREGCSSTWIPRWAVFSPSETTAAVRPANQRCSPARRLAAALELKIGD